MGDDSAIKYKTKEECFEYTVTALVCGFKG